MFWSEVRVVSMYFFYVSAIKNQDWLSFENIGQIIIYQNTLFNNMFFVMIKRLLFVAFAASYLVSTCSATVLLSPTRLDLKPLLISPETSTTTTTEEPAATTEPSTTTTSDDTEPTVTPSAPKTYPSTSSYTSKTTSKATTTEPEDEGWESALSKALSQPTVMAALISAIAVITTTLIGIFARRR